MPKPGVQKKKIEKIGQIRTDVKLRSPQGKEYKVISRVYTDVQLREIGRYNVEDIFIVEAVSLRGWEII